VSADDRLTPEERKARKAARQAEYRARPEVKARMAEYRARPEVKTREKARAAEYGSRPEVKARKRALFAEQYARAEVKAQIRAREAEYRARPEVKARIAAYRARPDVKAQMKALKAEYESRPEVKARRRATHYGLTVQALEALLAAGCAAATIGDGDRCKGILSIDHDHGCCNRVGSCGGCVRAALCDTHNRGLGFYESSLSWAGKYLARHQAKQEGGRS